MTTPSKPTLASFLPFRDVQMWWQPSLWAEVRVCVRGWSGRVDEWIFKEEEPELDIVWVGVTAMEKMSLM